jgi:hypothetical protein
MQRPFRGTDASVHSFGSGIRSRASWYEPNADKLQYLVSEITSLPKRIGGQFLDATDKNAPLERALHLFGSLPLDWRDHLPAHQRAALSKAGHFCPTNQEHLTHREKHVR